MSKLIWIQEGADGDRYLGKKDDLAYNKGAKTESADGATLQELADYCDMAAEGANYHHFVGVHEKLGALIAKHSSTEAATAVMRQIAESGGLHEFND